MTVRRFKAGVPPSKTKTGLILWNNSCITDEHAVHVFKTHMLAPASLLANLDDATEGPNQVSVLDDLAVVITHGFDELRQPDAHIHRERLQ